MAEGTIHLVGFGSQGSAWAQCLRASGWQVHVYLSREGESFQKAQKLDFVPSMIDQLPARIAECPDSSPHWVALLCPDSEISGIYNQFIAPIEAPIRLLLAHGYAVYSSELILKNPLHGACLLAPKSIGPKLLQNFQTSFPNPHGLVAAYCLPAMDRAETPEAAKHRKTLMQIVRGLGFASSSLVPATFEQEAMGDLISEQGLLCGGLFTLLNWTLEAMSKAGIPDALIREECLSELELITGMVRDLGPALTFQSISHAAQAGTIAMGNRLEVAKKDFLAQVESIENREFARYFKSRQWREQASVLVRQLNDWEQRLSPNNLAESSLRVEPSLESRARPKIQQEASPT